MIRAVLALLLLAGPAMAHSWYDADCCSGTDCAPLEPDEVKALADGYHFRGFVLPYRDPRIRVSKDPDYHWCENPKGYVRCFYAPPGGT